MAEQIYTFSDSSPKNSLIKTDDGFLRCKCRIMRSGELLYPLSEKPGEDDTNYNASNGINTFPVFNNKIKVNVEESDLLEEESLKSLEGIPILAYEHEWVTPDNAKELIVGNVSGVPTIERDQSGNCYVVCETIITDPKVIEDIEKKSLVETSAAYTASSLDPNDENYSCKHSNIRYNHILFCPQGTGRAGRDVRIYNCTNSVNLEENDKMQKVKFNFGNKRFLNIDENEIDTAETIVSETETAIDSKDATIAALQMEIEGLKKQIEDLISAASNIDQVASELAQEMVEDTADAEVILNACATPEEKEKVMNSLGGVFGYSLYKRVLEVAGAPLKTENVQESKVAYKAVASMCKNKIMNQKTDEPVKQKITNMSEPVNMVRATNDRTAMSVNLTPKNRALPADVAASASGCKTW